MEKRRQALSEINVTPFVDVMLVLLIIFMVTAPLLQQGIDISLPQARGKELSPTERIDITIKKDGKIYLDKTAVTLKTLSAKLSGSDAACCSSFADFANGPDVVHVEPE